MKIKRYLFDSQFLDEVQNEKFDESLENVYDMVEKIIKQYKVMENWAKQTIGISKQQAKFLTMMQSTLCLFAELRSIAGNYTKKGKFLKFFKRLLSNFIQI